jgi:hypothetical protein
MGLLVKKIKKITIPLKHLFHKKCNKCFNGYIIYDHEEIIDINFTINVYKCNYCNEKYI